MGRLDMDKESKKKTTTIEISVENWTKFNSLKRVGESFNDVITRLFFKVEAENKKDVP